MNTNSKPCLICKKSTDIETIYNKTFYICHYCSFAFTLDYEQKVLTGMGMDGSWSGPGGGGFREYFLVKMLFKELNLKSFLLFGTGNTKTFETLLKEGFDVIGCDISKDVVKFKCKKHGKNLFYTPETLPVNKKFDAIIAVEVIEHFHQPKKSFNLLFSYLKPNGIICGTTDYFIGKSILESDKNQYMKWDDHVAYWNTNSLNEISKQFNYNVSSFKMIRPGSVLPDEKFGKLWPNKRVFFLHSALYDEYFSNKFTNEPILPIDKP